MTNKLLTTPVLFLIFNRPDTTQKVFAEIRKAKPKKLFVSADGPRPDKPGEAEKCQAARDIIKQVDWDCEVFTNFRERNLGCKIAVSSGIDWFFEHVEEGIILEDDTLPNQSFFWFCQELLERYRDDERVMMITGTNYLLNKFNIQESYFFSRYFAIWGWATWKRAWKLYDIKMTDWPHYKKNDYLSLLFSDKRIINRYKINFDMTYKGEIDTWDTQWNYTCIFNNGLCVVPKTNLITNIGIEGTHTTKKGKSFVNMPIKQLNMNNFKHPTWTVLNAIYDRKLYDIILTRKLSFNIIVNLLKAIIRRIFKE